MASISRPLAVALLIGTALLGIGAALHPMLPADVPGQLRMIAASPSFRAVHLAMLCGSGLIIAGVWTRLLLRQPVTPTPLIGALVLVCLGICFNAIDIAFMGGSGWHMATAYVAGQSELAPVFEALHRFGLLTARFGNFLVALGALVLGFAEREDPESPRWMAWLAWIAAAGGLAGVVLVPEASLLMLTAVTLISGWSVGTSVRALRGDAVSA
ncbi:MAG TPA: hypothetical protein VF461_04160 [Gemmatimonadaceae bacterium]